jgi:hypothetical protein
MKTYEIPTSEGIKTISASSKSDALSQLSSKLGLTPINPNVPTVTNSGSFTSTPKLTLPNAPVYNYGNVSPSIDTAIADAKSRATAEKNQAVIDAQNTKDSNKQTIFDLTTLLGESGKITEQAYKAEGVDVAKQEYDNYTNQLEAEQNALRRRLETLDKNEAGLFGGAVAQEKDRANRESLSKQADLAILQNASIRRYDTARDIADRSVELKLEPIKAKLEAYKFIYEENKDNFNTLEKRQYESQIKEEERVYEKQQADLKEVSDLSLTALENGAPSSVAIRMRAAKTAEEAMRIGGSYIMSIASRKAQAELAAMNNPVGVQIPKSVFDLKAADRTPLSDSRATISEVEEMQQILNRNADSLAVLETGTSEDARRFLQLRSNVVDKLARERTGAVIGNDEKRDFKRILGVGLRQLATKDINEVNKGLETFKDKHKTVVKLIDPDGSISAFIDYSVPSSVADSIISQYSGKSTGSSTLNSY